MFSIERGEKFAAIAVCGSPRWKNLSDPIDLGDGMGAMWAHPVKIEEYWLRTLGTIKAREIEATSLWLIAKCASDTSHPLTKEDQQLSAKEDQQLSDRVNDLFYSLFLATPLPFDKGFHLRGVNLTGKREVRGFGEVATHYYSEDTQSTMGPEILRKAKGIMDSGWRSIFYRQPNPMRIAYGFGAYIRGLQEQHFDTRLHQFVRALEGVVRPHNAKQFTARCQVIIGKRAETQDFLGECYSLRNKIEHVNDWREVLPSLSSREQTERILRDVLALGKVCRYVFEKLATSPGVRIHFEDDVIDNFWRGHSNKESVWGPPLDLAL